MNEWRAVPGCPKYLISSIGQVRHKDSGNPIRFGLSDSGYQRVKISGEDGKRKWHLIHLLVLRVFVGEPPSPAHQGCHDDGQKHNNVVGNLLWKTEEENRQDKKRHGTMKGGVPGTQRVSKRRINSILRRWDKKESFSTIAAALDIHRSTVSRIVRKYRPKEGQ